MTLENFYFGPNNSAGTPQAEVFVHPLGTFAGMQNSAAVKTAALHTFDLEYGTMYAGEHTVMGTLQNERISLQPKLEFQQSRKRMFLI